MKSTTVKILTYILEDDIEVHEIMRDIFVEYGIEENNISFFDNPEMLFFKNYI